MEQTDRARGEGDREDWKKSGEEHICIYAEPMDTDNNVMRTRGMGWGLGGVGHGGGNGGHL